jgi:hypothetical protein
VLRGDYKQSKVRLIDAELKDGSRRNMTMLEELAE